MLLDYNSLLLAIGFAGACLTITLFATWLSARSEGFLLTWSIGGLLIVGSVLAYSAYVQKPLPLAGFLAQFATVITCQASGGRAAARSAAVCRSAATGRGLGGRPKPP